MVSGTYPEHGKGNHERSNCEKRGKTSSAGLDMHAAGVCTSPMVKCMKSTYGSVIFKCSVAKLYIAYSC